MGASTVFYAIFETAGVCWKLHCWYNVLGNCVLSLSCRFDLLLRPATTSYLFPVREQFQSAVSPDLTVIAAANQGSQGMQLLSHVKGAQMFGLHCCQQNHEIDVLGSATLSACFPSRHVFETFGFQAAVSL